MTRYLVTGGTGFLGRHLVSLLREGGRDVRVLVRPTSDVSGLDGVEIVRGDVTRRADLEAALKGVQRVFHVAAETRDGQPPERYQAVNLHAVTTLLELAPAAGVERVVHTSHYFAIGRSGEPRSAKGFVNDEFWTHDPGDMHDAHELSKYDAENSVNQRVSLGEPVLALIPTMMYGPEKRPVSGIDGLAHGNRIVRMLAEHARGRYPGIPGDGSQLWNLVHVEDVARAHVQVMDAQDPAGSSAWPPPRWTHWHYLCGGENVSVQQLFEQFGRLAGVGVPRTVRPKKGLLGRLFGGGAEPGRSPERFLMDSHEWAYSSAMAGAEWDYRPRSLAAGLEPTVAWMRSSGLVG